MRASMRGLKRSVIVMEARLSVFSIDMFINRASSEVSFQKSASSSSFANRGTSLHFVRTLMALTGQVCVLAVVKADFRVGHGTRLDHPIALAIGPENGEE